MGSALAIHGGPPLRETPFPPWPIVGQPEQDALAQVLRGGAWGRHNGSQVEKFEGRFAKYQGAMHGIAVTSGTAALRIALMAAGIEAGDEVIVPPYTFLATATAVVEANATPVFADILADTCNIDPDAIQRAITPKTKAVIPVHFGGLAADMDAIAAIAEKHGLTVIEDACHGHGAEYNERRLGSIGHMGCFSFQSSKNLTCGEGGFITTSDDRLADACRAIHDCGRLTGGQWYEHHVISGNYRMSELHGAMLNCQFDRLEEQTALRDRNGQYLAERLAEIPGISPQARGPECTRHSYHLFVFRYDASATGVPRGTFLKAVSAEGVPASEGYPIPLHRQPLFTDKSFGPFTGDGHAPDYTRVDCPVCEQVCRSEGAWLCQSMLLGSREDVDDIVSAFRKVYNYRQELAVPS